MNNHILYLLQLAQNKLEIEDYQQAKLFASSVLKLNPKNFDKHGNYNLGISEQLVFPEIDYDSVEQRRGFNITIVTTAKNSTESFFLLKELGVPFTK